MDRRVLLLVLDSVGVGAMPDADRYGDEGSNTLGNVARAVRGLKMPVLESLGLANIIPVEGLKPVEPSRACYGRMAEASPGKDTITGHWEMAGIILDQPFQTYPHGFPEYVIEEFSKRIGRGVLGNEVASGTEIIKRLGAEHMDTAKPIVYTSADSVFQIAAHEEIISLEDLYEMCREARELLCGRDKVGRIIARPFVGSPGDFKRTANRRDFSLEPPSDTILDLLVADGREVIGIGKIKDIYAGRGVTTSHKTQDNAHGLELLKEITTSGSGDLIFTNLVDFDSSYGHRNDAKGYARALEAADAGIGRVLNVMHDKDVIIITADHGCDPTHPGSDHTREYVPLLVWTPGMARGSDLGTRRTFADVAATLGQLLKVDYQGPGTSFAGYLGDVGE